MSRSTSLGGCSTVKLVVTLLLAIGAIGLAGVTVAPVIDPATPAPSAPAKSCRPGFVHAVINGAHKCLHRGQRCERRFDRRYHRYGFHCHTGRLTGGPRKPPPTAPPPPPPVGRVVAEIPVDAGPIDVAVGEGSVWVADHNGDTVSRIDPLTNHIAATIDLVTGAIPSDGIAVSDSAVWVTGGTSGRLWRIDPQTNKIDGSVGVGASAVGVDVGFGSVWVSDFRDGKVYRVEPQG